MYKIKKFENHDDFHNAYNNICVHEMIAYDATNSYYPILIKELGNDEVTFYDFYPRIKIIKKVTKEIEFSNIGEPFFVWCSRRYYLNNFLRMKI